MARGVSTISSSGITARSVVAQIVQLTKTLLSTNSGIGASDVGVEDSADYVTGTTVESVLAELGLTKAGVSALTDPGNAGAIPVTRSGCVPIVTAGAETRTLAVPTHINQRLTLFMKTDGGDCVITSAQSFNVAGNTTITLTAVNQSIQLVAISSGVALRWRVAQNDGPTLG